MRITDRAATIFPAVQNILLAARGLGLEIALTTRHTRYETEINSFRVYQPTWKLAGAGTRWSWQSTTGRATKDR